MTPSQRRRLMQLWNQRCPFKGDESRDARLVYLARVIGHALGSSSELTDAEATAAIRALESEKGKVVGFPNRNLITKGQIWKIRQIESYLGWASVPERLAGYLRVTCRGTDRPEKLGFRQAIGVIDGLLRLQARGNIKAVKGEAYKVPRPELAAEVVRIQKALRYWRPQELPKNVLPSC